MRAALRLGIARLRRRPAQTATQTLVLAVAVALLGAMILFIGHSLRTMTASATRSVPLDLQGPVADYGQARSLAGQISKQPDIAQASTVATAPFAGVSHQGTAGITDAGSGAILAVPPGYLHHIDAFRFLRGGLRPGQVVLDQQLAATLRAGVGDTVGLRLGAHAPPRSFKVAGVALVTAPDVLFQPLNPQVGPAPRRQPTDRLAVDRHLAGGRRVQAADEVEQRRLPAPRRPRHCHELPRLHRQRDSRQRRDHHLAKPVRLANVRHHHPLTHRRSSRSCVSAPYDPRASLTGQSHERSPPANEPG